jgi:hypothetical protein
MGAGVEAAGMKIGKMISRGGREIPAVSRQPFECLKAVSKVEGLSALSLNCCSPSHFTDRSQLTADSATPERVIHGWALE